MFSNKSLRNAVLLSTLALGASAFAAEKTVDYDHNANFRSYHTFSFYKVQTSDPFYVQRIKDEMTKDLTQAGWTMVPSGGDVAITAIGSTKDETEYNTFYDGLGGGGFGWRGWGGWGGGWGGDSQTTVSHVPVGTLMIDMYDRNTHQLIWRGRTTDTLSTNGEKNIGKVNKDIDHMLNGFPPKTRG